MICGKSPEPMKNGLPERVFSAGFLLGEIAGETGGEPEIAIRWE